MNTLSKKKPYRWVLLRHSGAPDDFRGIHFDFLLEDKIFCRTWRLSDIPLLDGPSVEAIYIAPHKLEWLEIEEKVVSGNRGVATRIKKGIFANYFQTIPSNFLNLTLQWENSEVDLVIDENGCRILRKKS